ncbi:terminase large subunit [Mycobacterium phage MyraDee]|uniref:Terminase large subunit n=1 Tax=Mycobacterium phage MyraDee TaxID=2024303 RepID=A0A222YZJ1_9CAUD|nr:terminase large subunit [Mycobacterium phage MyraDee]ASR77117.1 terminase large subunit [Mycobacterium phage MyraDee]
MSDTPELAPSPAHITGPTWQRTTDGKFYLPEHSLGYAVLAWMFEYLRLPGGPDAGSNFMPTDEQARFIVWWYAVDKFGKFVYRNGLLRRLKGWGKDPLAGAMALAELCGPVMFSHWENGRPVGKRKPSAWIQVAAVSQDQTRNTFSLFPVLCSEELKAEFKIEFNKTIVYAKNIGGVIEAATSNPLTLEGKRPTFVIKNETQWWIETNNGHAMSEVIAGNVDKSAYGVCRALSICNGHIPGQDSDAERDYDAHMDVMSGKAIDTGFLYDALEAPADTPLSEIPSPVEDPEGFDKGMAKLREGLEIARGDAVWLDLDTIIMSMLDRRRPVTESRRKFLNQINAHEDSWIAPHEWNALSLTDNLFKLKKGDRITLGFDGSKSNDHTALVACRVEDGMLFLIKTWDPEKFAGGEVPREDVDATVRSCFERFDVVAFRADVKEFEAYVDQWGRDFKRKIKVNATPGNPIAFDMRGQTKRFALDCERFLDAVLEAELFHDGSPVLRQHILNARRHPTTYDAISIRKASKDSTKKIDAAVCAVLAFGARQDFLMSKKNRSRRAVVIQ